MNRKQLAKLIPALDWAREDAARAAKVLGVIAAMNPTAFIQAVEQSRAPANPLERITAADLSRIDGYIREGEKIQAIKLVRELTGLPLKESKDYVDSRS